MPDLESPAIVIVEEVVQVVEDFTGEPVPPPYSPNDSQPAGESEQQGVRTESTEETADIQAVHSSSVSAVGLSLVMWPIIVFVSFILGAITAYMFMFGLIDL